MSKVFCRDCEHYLWVGCGSNPGDSWRAPGELFADPREKNANNDCGEFEQYVPPPPPPEPPPAREIHYAAPWSWKFWK